MEIILVKDNVSCHICKRNCIKLFLFKISLFQKILREFILKLENQLWSVRAKLQFAYLTTEFLSKVAGNGERKYKAFPD